MVIVVMGDGVRGRKEEAMQVIVTDKKEMLMDVGVM